MGNKATTKFILQIKLILGFNCDFKASHITGATITSGMGLRSDEDVSVGIGIFNALDYIYLVSLCSLSPRCLHYYGFI